MSVSTRSGDSNSHKFNNKLNIELEKYSDSKVQTLSEIMETEELRQILCNK